jgi:molybdenum cofactor biosynthesis protein B
MADSGRAFIPIGIAVLTVSDTRAMEDDKSGSTLAARLEGACPRLNYRRR